MNPVLRLAMSTALGIALASCGGGGGGGGGGAAICTVASGGGTLTVSGLAQYQRVPHNATTHALDYNATALRPIRGATVQVRRGTSNSACVSGAILGSAVSDATGNYAITGVNFNEDAKVCVRAEMLLADVGAGTPSWDVQVVDNTQSSALYVLQSAALCTGAVPLTQNLTATTGWGGTSYTSTRAAAPFAILDDIYMAIQKIIAVEANADFAALDVNWSVNNTNSGNNPAIGQIGTSYYSNDEIYILGDDNNDTDEFDDHVIIHEYGHYLEDNLSRSDSIGGSHSGGELLDPRVAYGEGFGNAWSGIVTDDPLYQDSLGAQQATGFQIDVENETVSAAQDGWFSETSVQRVLYDLYDATNEGAGSGDTASVGLAAMWTSWRTTQSTTPTLTTIFSMLDGVRAAAPGSVAFINALAVANDINGSDALGSGETNSGGLTTLALPVYTAITVGGGPVQVCSTKQEGEYNALGNRRFLAFTIGVGGTRTFNVLEAGAPVVFDPDAVLFSAGVEVGASPHEAVGDETWQDNLGPGNYVLEVYPYTNVDGQAGSGGNNLCISVEIT